jgi:uncharacterized protein YbdZ (MbtH family)
MIGLRTLWTVHAGYAIVQYLPNPFEDPDAEYLTLVNDEGQHSLWPTFAEVPAGWTAVFGPAARCASISWRVPGPTCGRNA